MAGVKGRSGGPRPGSGRPKKKPDAALQVEPAKADATEEARGFLQRVMRGEVDPSPAQLHAAKALLSAGVKVAPAGKKEAAEEASKTAHAGTSWADLLGGAPAQ